MSYVVLAIRFACELAALGAIGWWGARAGGVPLAIALPAVAATLWGAWIAPRARHRLRDPLRLAAESVVWFGAIAALAGLGQLAAAVGFGVIALGTAIAARRYEPRVTSSAK
jgi:hypothetical protein